MDLSLAIPSPIRGIKGEMLLSSSFHDICFAQSPSFFAKPTRQHPPKPRFNPTVVQATQKGSRRSCGVFDLHNEIVPYDRAWAWQKDILREKKALIDNNQDCPDTLIVLQHHPAYTMGTASSPEYLLFDPEDDPPHPVYPTERGGQVTYHGPGQLVMYPIINLRNHKMDTHWYIRSLEEIVIRTLVSTFSVKASRLEGLTGVWVGNEKLAAVGVRASRWITYNGLALNVTTDLTPFQWIVPCGIRDRGVGSLRGILNGTSFHERQGRPSDDAELIDITYKSLIKEFSEVFQLDVCYKSIPTELFN